MATQIRLPNRVNASRIRVIAIVVVIAAFIALTAFALLARAYRPGHSGVRVPGAAGARSTTQIAQSAAAVTPTSQADGTSASAAPSASAVPASAPALAPVTPTPSAPATTPPSSGTAAPPPSTNGLPPCPLGLAVPTQQAGLANLVQVVPLFGPFSPEAFAMVPAFEPAFPLAGPLIVSGGKQLDAHADQVNTVVGVVHPAEQAGFDAMSPLYAPYRQQFLAGEATAASAVQPGVAAAAGLPGASCVPAALAAATGG
jgi:hypothetical protein